MDGILVTMASTLFLSVISFIAVYISLWLIILLTHDEKEPPLAKTKFPFLGPLIELIKGGPKFYVQQRDKYNFPIYTLRAPFQRVYIVNATELVPALQKQWRHVTFAPVFAGAGKVVGMSQEACDHMHEDFTDETKNFNHVWVNLVTPRISPGSSGLDDMNRRAIQVVCEQIDGLVRELELDQENSKTEKSIGLQDWLYKTMLLASTDAVYGPLNPFRDSGVEKAWDTFEMDFLTLVLTPIPHIVSGYFTRKVVRAREVVIDAFVDFLRRGGTKSASALVRLKHAHHLERFNERDVAATDLALSFAILGNTKASAWWLIYHIFSDEQVLSDLRHELSSVPGLVTYTEDLKSNGEVTASVDLSNIRTQCPVLLSTVQEMLRYRSVANSVRKVIEQDVLLDGQFLLKKGSYLILPHAVQHTSARAFGSNVNEFDHKRFVRRSGPTRRNEKQQENGGTAVPGLDRRAFYAFGGGHDKCPGRHFATMELLALAALMVLRFDIQPVGDGKWTEPTWDNSPLAAGVPYPDREVYVRLKARDGTVNGSKRRIAKWNVSYSGGEMPLDMLAEDGQQ